MIEPWFYYEAQHYITMVLLHEAQHDITMPLLHKA